MPFVPNPHHTHTSTCKHYMNTYSIFSLYFLAKIPNKASAWQAIVLYIILSLLLEFD